VPKELADLGFVESIFQRVGAAVGKECNSSWGLM